MKQYQGYILLLTLMFIQVSVLLGLTALEQAFIAEKEVSTLKLRRHLHWSQQTGGNLTRRIQV